MQGNRIAALDPSQESDAVYLDLSKAADSSSSIESDPMDFDSEVTALRPRRDDPHLRELDLASLH